MAILIACGNSICGNSAIAAVAPVIGADGDEVASSIAFTAVLGVVVVLGLPLLASLFGLSVTQYGVLAGLTVYAVPQVLAATLPIGALANQVGTVVKLVRVLLLGPVVLALSLMTRRLRDEADETAPHVTAGDRPKRGRPALHQLVPWFIMAFLCGGDAAFAWPNSGPAASTDGQLGQRVDDGFNGGTWVGRGRACGCASRPSSVASGHTFAHRIRSDQPWADPSRGPCITVYPRQVTRSFG